MSINRAALTHIVGKPIGPIGYGLMSFAFPSASGLIEHNVAAEAMKTALNQGANLWNGGIHYGTPTANSLHLLRYYFKKYPEDAEKVVLSIKGALDSKHQPIGTRDGIRASVEGALEVLEGIKRIDVFEMARVDPNTPIETSIKAIAELVEEGKIGGVGLSEVSAKTIRRAHAVHPIAAVEIELSLFTPDPLNNGIMDTCHELSIPVVAYSPVGRGWLSGKFRTADDLPKDFRSTLDRFKPEFFEKNFKLVEAVESLAKRKHLKPSQVAIAWVARQGAIPIPGSTNIDRINLNSRLETLSDEDMAELEKIMDQFPVGGGRYAEAHAKLLNA